MEFSYQLLLQVEYLGSADGLQTVEYAVVSSADVGNHVIQTENGERVIIPISRSRDFSHFEYSGEAQYVPLQSQDQHDGMVHIQVPIDARSSRLFCITFNP